MLNINKRWCDVSALLLLQRRIFSGKKKKLERDVALNIHMELGKSLAFTVKQVQEVLML